MSRARAGLVGAWLLAAALLAACASAPSPPPGESGETPPDGRLALLADVLAHEDRRDAGDGLLTGLLAHPDGAMRRRACLALGRVGDPAIVAALAALSADPDPEVRGAAAFGLGEIADPAVVAVLIPWLSDRDPTVRALTVEALTKAPSADGSAAALASLGAEKDAAARESLATTFRFQDPAWIPLYLERAATDRAALYALARFDMKALLGKDGKALSEAQKDAYVQVMIRASPAGDPFSAALAARGLGRFPEVKVPFREQALRGSLARPEISVRVEALRGAGKLLKGKATIWPEVRRLADDGNGSVRLTALEALGSIGGPEAEGLLRDRRRTGFPRERAVALGALFTMGPAYMDRDLTDLVQDEDWQQRSALAAALGDPKVTYGAEALEALLHDPDPRVRPVALSSITARDLPGTQAALRTALADDDPILRATAADELLSRREDAVKMREALRESWARAESDRDNDARLAICDAFAKADMTVELAFALQDRDWLVRAKAATLLQKADGKKRDVAPLRVERPEADYLRALDPSQPRRAVVATSRGSFTIELLWEDAPLTCLNFVTLIRKGFYDGLAYHRIVPGFVVQDGCPRGDGSGGPGFQIRCEINTLRYAKGMVGMALSGKDTGGSQYFVTLAPTPHLDGGYTIFGRVAEGMDVVEELVQGDRTLSIALP